MSPPDCRTVLEARIVTGQGGGPDKTILNTPRFMKSRGYPTVCAYLRPPGDPGFAAIEERAQKWNAPLEVIDDSGPFDLGVLGRLRRICDRHNPVIWHGHDYKTNFLGLFLARKRPLTLVTTLHGWVKRTWKTPLYYALDRRCLKRYAAVVAVSPDLFDAGLACGVPPERCFLVPNAVDAEEFRRTFTTTEAKAARFVVQSKFLVGAVGRLSTEKGFDLLIRAIAELAREGLDVELQIAGDGEQRVPLERLATECGVRERVKLVGFHQDLSLFYQSLDAFVLSSLREGLPNAVLEAMAYGVPVLATRIAGVPMVVVDGQTGLVVQPGSAGSLAAGLRRLHEESSLRTQIGAEGRRLIESQFSLARRMDRMKEIYDLTLERDNRT